MKKTIKKLLVLSAMFLILSGIVLNTEVSAAPKLNKKSKTITQGKSYTLKISGVKSKKIKKVTIKQSRKVLKIKKKSKKIIVIKGLKKGKTTLKITIKYKKRVKGKKKVTLKCKINVKQKKTSKKSAKNNKAAEQNKAANNSVANPDQTIDDNIYGKTVEEMLTRENITKMNDYTIKAIDVDTGETWYGIIVNPLSINVDFYSKSEYDEIINEAERIVKTVGITDEMTDQEKIYRIGRYMVDHIDYVAGCGVYKIHDALFGKETVCAGYSTTFAFLCRYIGIDCDYVEAMYGASGHAWNYVRLGDYCYVADLTDAYFLKKYYGGGAELFRGIEDLSDDELCYIDDIYKTEEYQRTHPVDTVDYYIRCENEGEPYLKIKELSNRYEAFVK